MHINTVIMKPTKKCNADCTYCCAPPDGERPWSFEIFQGYFDKLRAHLSPAALILWHGGEPMLLGPEYYERAYEYARGHIPDVQFSMQTNLLLYNPRRWQRVFAEVFKGSLSTSFDPDMGSRTLKGSAQAYASHFKRKLESVLADGFRPLVIGTYSDETIHLAHDMYDQSLALGEDGFGIRVNYMHPSGRVSGSGARIAPELYGEVLLELYERWLADAPSFVVTPLNLMFQRVAGLDAGHCPWTRQCGGRFLGIEPNGDVYNCSEYADLKDKTFCFGNLGRQDVADLLASRPAVMIRRRAAQLPSTCMSCRHFAECEGGCSRDATLFDRGVLGKFYYCISWKMVFDRIKQSIRSGEADRLLLRYRVDPGRIRERLAA